MTNSASETASKPPKEDVYEVLSKQSDMILELQEQVKALLRERESGSSSSSLPGPGVSIQDVAKHDSSHSLPASESPNDLPKPTFGLQSRVAECATQTSVPASPMHKTKEAHSLEYEEIDEMLQQLQADQ